MNVLLNIEVDGTNTTALTRELQTDPVRGTLLHADFVQINLKEEVEVEVPVHLVGESPGAKGGGVLEHPLFTLHVRCLPTNVPESIDADISGLEVGDSLRVSELTVTGDFEILNDPEAVVASVAAPITEEQLEAMVAEAGPDVEEAPAEVPEGEAAPADEAAAEAGSDATAEDSDQS